MARLGRRVVSHLCDGGAAGGVALQHEGEEGAEGGGRLGWQQSGLGRREQRQLVRGDAKVEARPVVLLRARWVWRRCCCCCS